MGRDVPFRTDPTAPARYLLHRVLYAQQAHFLQEGDYARSLEVLGLADLTDPSLAGPIRMTGYGQTYTVEAQIRLAPDRTASMKLHEDGRLEMAGQSGK